MSPAARLSLTDRLGRGETLDLRGDGKAGGGLVVVVQAFGAALVETGGLDVQDWPLFSSARKGANVRAYLRMARRPIEASHQVATPDIALLMNEEAALEVDFAEGTNGAVYVINSAAFPSDAALRHRLGGTVATVPGDELGLRHLGRPLGNVAVLAALVRAAELCPPEVASRSLEHALEKRRLPRRIVVANLALFEEALAQVRVGTFPTDASTDHRPAVFHGYGPVPPGAQAALRTARDNRTAGYGRSGVRTEFFDPESKCNGCALCVVQCPEGIIDFTADPARGPIVHGARFLEYCKVCRECISACPLHLFHEVAAVVRPEGAIHDG